MFFLMQIIFIVLPSNMAAVQNLYRDIKSLRCLVLRGPFLESPENFSGPKSHS